MGKKKSKSKAIAISSAGVITWNTPLKGSLYRVERNVSIRINPSTNQLLLIAGKDVEDANGTVGEVSPSLSAIAIVGSGKCIGLQF